MKAGKIYFLVLAGACTFSACEQEQGFESEIYKDVSLTLDKGERWDVPNTMQVYMDSSLRLIAGLKEDTELTDEMSAQLIAYKDSFVSQCSMDGEAHDVLHAWLLPYIDILDMAKEAQSAVQKEEAVNELLKARELYLEFFD